MLLIDIFNLFTFSAILSLRALRLLSYLIEQSMCLSKLNPRLFYSGNPCINPL